MFFDTTLTTRLKAHLSSFDAVANFWRPLGPLVWFGKDPAFDLQFRNAFAAEHAAAARGELMPWLTSADGALSLLILLDQYPRNAFRGTARMYATDPLARLVADTSVELGHDRTMDEQLRLFFYLPFGHSENLADQERAVALCSDLPEPAGMHSRGHREIIARFGRFPHRNAILDRKTTPDEEAWLAAGGFSG